MIFKIHSAGRYRAPLPWHITCSLYTGTKATLYPTCLAILMPFKVTTNKLEKDPHTELKPEPYSLHGCTVIPGDHVQINPQVAKIHFYYLLLKH